MVRIDWYFDVVSPYAYLAFEALPAALAPVTVPHAVHYRPVLFAGLLEAFGQKGPAEIAPKRQFTYEHVVWLAQRHGIALRAPRAHPFNPLPLLRALVAVGGAEPNRAQVAAAFRYVWREGALPDEPGFAELLGALDVAPAQLDDAAVKAQLRANTAAAQGAGVFGVPMAVAVRDGDAPQRFWGLDALPMLAAWIDGDALFASAEFKRAAALPVGVQRKAVAST